MAAVFEFETTKSFHFSSALGSHFGMPAENNRVYLPHWLGQGFIQEVYLPNDLTLCIHDYVLREPFTLIRQASGPRDFLTLKFAGRRLPQPTPAVPAIARAAVNGGEVEFGTGNFFRELTLPAQEAIRFLVIATTRQMLDGLLDLKTGSGIVAQSVADSESFLLHEGLTPEMEKALTQISLVDANTPLARLLYQNKAQELIYLLFARLLSRTDKNAVPVDPADAEKIYATRERLLSDLSVTPQLPKLASAAGMSLTKMKQLFHQIFGKSIYNYYQSERMAKAASLLTHLTVSEAGYHVGYSNLSHFSRVFEKHYQMKPKRFKDSLKSPAGH